jgi:hypothetical protein
MTREFRAASRLVDRLASQLLIRPHAGRRTARRNTGAGASSLLSTARRWPWRTSIVALAVCEKRCEGKRLAGQLVVTFFVQQKLAKSRLEPQELIPPEIELPDGQKVSTDIVEAAGVPLAESGPVRPLRPGCAVAHFRGAPGTMGPIVRKIGGTTPLFISCSHVIARAGLASKDDPIEQPPDTDGAVGPNVIAKLTNDFTRLTPFAVNTLDVGVAEVAPGVQLSNEIIGGARPTGVSTLEPEDLRNVGAISLTRFGARTGVQPGGLEGVHGVIPLEIPALGSGTIVFARVGLYRTHSLGGDSGAPIVRAQTGELFGMHIGRIGDFGVFCPIKAIFDKFALELLS